MEMRMLKGWIDQIGEFISFNPGKSRLTNAYGAEITFDNDVIGHLNFDGSSSVQLFTNERRSHAVGCWGLRQNDIIGAVGTLCYELNKGRDLGFDFTVSESFSSALE